MPSGSICPFSLVPWGVGAMGCQCHHFCLLSSAAPPESQGSVLLLSSAFFHAQPSLMMSLLSFVSPFPTQGTVGMFSAPAAATRRCRFPASSFLSPVESASLAITTCTPPAPAWTSNWRNPLLPLQTEASAFRGQVGQGPGQLPLGEPCTHGVPGEGPVAHALWSGGQGTEL